MRRREFVAKAAKATTALSAAPLIRAAGSNERINIGWIGCGGRGFYHYEFIKKMPDIRIAAVCDVYERNAVRARRYIGEGCKDYKDFREILDRKDIDAVLIATPDHWHAIPAILACEAGKDVYVEKPVAHNIAEGRAMVQAARRHDRIVQVGMQQRCNIHFDEMRRIIQSGELGKVTFVRIWTCMNRYPNGIGVHPESDPPEGLDWDFYLGPAPMRPYKKSRFLSTFRYFWDYAGGGATDLGTHRFDMLHKVMGVHAPKTVAAVGGIFALEDDAEVPDTLQATYEYPGFVLSYDMSHVGGVGTGALTPGRKYYRAIGPEARPFGMAFHGTNGTIMADRLGFEVFPEAKPGIRVAEQDRLPREALRMDRSEGSSPDATELMLRNFFDCVRSRKKPKGDVERGQQAAIVGHLANISYRTGRKLRWDAEKERIIGDLEADRLLARKPRKPWNLI